MIKERESMRIHNRIVCLKVFEKLEKLKVDNRVCKETWAGEEMIEMDLYPDRHAVKLNACTCTCRKWQISDIPCIHVISCMYSNKKHLEDFVDDYYEIEM